MPVDRRQFLRGTALVAGATAVAGVSTIVTSQQQRVPPGVAPTAPVSTSNWQAVREAFVLDPDFIHMSAMLLASHPRPVREAIARHRDGLDTNTVRYIEANDDPLTEAARQAAAAYMGTGVEAIALTGSTTEGVGLAYNGVQLAEGDEILTTDEDYYVTHEATRLAAARSGATVRRIALYEDIADVTEEALAARIVGAVSDRTRVVALTWVHSSTGLKLPLARIAAGLAEINARRSEEARQVLLCVDGVHGFGIENVTLDELGADLFMAGCHKWLFGPRGTGIIAASPRGWRASRPTVPSFIDSGVFSAWLRDAEPRGAIDGAAMSPGGFKAFEHRWALGEAFAFHQRIGRARVASRTHELAGMLKEGLAAMPHVTLVTPRDARLSAGIVSFTVEGYGVPQAVDALRERGIIASAAPYATSYVRLTPAIRNLPAEIDKVLAAVHDLG